MTDQEEFIFSVKQIVAYWNGLDIPCEEKVRGVAFTILSTIDQSSSFSGPYSLRKINEDGSEGEDIAGGLHELFYK